MHYPDERKSTIQNVDNFDAKVDAEILRKAMKGFGTDKKAIINVLGRRGNLQRLEIANAFKTLYGKDLIEDLKSEVSGNFKEVIIALMTYLPEYYAKELNNAIAGLGTDEEAIIEILCSLSNEGIQAVAECYKNLYGKSLEKDLKDDTSGHFRRLCVSLCMGKRDENRIVDETAVKNDAVALYKAGEKRFGTDESVFNSILVSRSHVHLRKVFDEYKQLTGHDIEQSIRSEFSGDICNGLIFLVRCIRNKVEFFAKRLHQSMKGIGTDDKTLIRIIVSRSEVDLGYIKVAFKKLYGKNLESWIEDDTSGHYKKLLLEIISEHD